ncbi:hypothetical protein [Steroidobacter sp.]|uniref:hypothetical protein n=1 Tax=Steroidobacter sp. TaxID=1978227 RepID=UPI001A41BEA4|nr:hypothetical protein [Steroidobacter sp.]MBL8269685.1 hypothetical protein [Steroidobacter sp.]
MRPSIGLSSCIVTGLWVLVGCASPQNKPVAATQSAQETDQQRAQRLINYSVESGQPINTADGKKLLCKQETVTNTRLKNKKVCLTEDEWLARTGNARESFREAIRAGEYLPPKGN